LSLILRKVADKRVFFSKTARKIFDRNNIEMEKLNIGQLHRFYSSGDVIRVIK
jgi:hypothetical protein